MPRFDVSTSNSDELARLRDKETGFVTTWSVGFKKSPLRLMVLSVMVVSFFVTGCKRLAKQTKISPEASKVPTAPMPEQDSELSRAYQIVLEGELVHNIPQTAKIRDPFVVKAGLAEEVTESILKQLDINEPVTIEQEISYRPLGVELTLVADKESAFEIQDISSRRKVVITNHPGKWQWSVKPIKPGKHTLSIQTGASLQDDDHSNEAKHKVLASQVVNVESSLQESLQILISDNWLLLATCFTTCSFIYIGWKLGHLSSINSHESFSSSNSEKN